ncbi:hypothetical protein Tco_1154910 [Tanacetum coccineum]
MSCLGNIAYRRMPFGILQCPTNSRGVCWQSFDVIDRGVRRILFLVLNWEEQCNFMILEGIFARTQGVYEDLKRQSKNATKLDDALWAFRQCYKHLTDLIAAGEKRMFQLHELDELRYQAYENSRLYKERTKVWHDRKLRMRKEFKQGNKVLLFHSKYKFKQPKLRSRWLGPYVVKHQYPSGYVELYGKDGKTFIVNGHRLKLYHEEDNNSREAVTPFFPKE